MFLLPFFCVVEFENLHSAVPQNALLFKFRALLEVMLVCLKYHTHPVEASICLCKGERSLMVRDGELVSRL